MRKGWVAGLVIGSLAFWPIGAGTVEHGGQEHAGHEHGGQKHASQAAPAEPTTEQIREVISEHVGEIERDEGAFTIDDEVAGTTRTLTLERVHERVGKTGDFYYACADMRDTGSGELLDLDFDVEAEDGELEVVDVRIHKLNGEARYTYDDNDNRVPLM